MDSCVTPNNYNNIHLYSPLNSRTVFHVVPQSLCWTIAHLDIGRRLLGVQCTGGGVNCPSSQSPKYSRFLDGIASQFSWPQEVCYCLINHIQTELITQIYSYSAIFTFLSQSIIHQTHVFSFQDFINSKGSCLWGGPIKLRNLFTTLLALTRLLDFEVTTLPYPTRSWKLLLVGAWP